MSYTGNDVINGLFGKLYDENGDQLQSTQEFEATEEFDKTDVIIPGKRRKSSKITGSKVSGKFTLDHIDTRLQKKVAENPTAKYNYIGRLEDPDVDGKEAVLFKGVSFDAVPIINWKVGEKGQREFAFTADDYEFTDAIE